MRSAPPAPAEAPASASLPASAPDAAIAPAVAAIEPAVVATPVERPVSAPTPPLQSDDGRLRLTDTSLTVRGQEFLLLDLERAELTPVHWILWYLLGGLGLAAVMIAFLQNWLRTMPAAVGMVATALLLLYGRRGTNRLRLHRMGRQVVNFALPGDTSQWQRHIGEVNRRIRRVHDQAAAEAAALLAEADAAMRAAALAAQLQAEAEAASLSQIQPSPDDELA